jgi:hypothetical protein
MPRRTIPAIVWAGDGSLKVAARARNQAFIASVMQKMKRRKILHVHIR